jgi:beta-1,4-mannosyl-glycoprotein beta-1,4-N-acetylglucosaminyltransferase
MTQESRRAAAFRRAYWDDLPALVEALAALLRTDRAAFDRRAGRAWEIRDARWLAAAAQAQAGAASPDSDLFMKAAVCLYVHDRPELQLQLLDHPCLDAARHPKAVFHRARALAAAGRWAEAKAEAELVSQLRPKLAPARWLLAELEERARLAAVAAGSKDWSDWRRSLDAALSLRASGAALAIARDALRLPIPRKRNRMRDLCSVLDAGLDCGLDVEAAAAVLDAAAEAHPTDSTVASLRLDCEVLAGRAEAALAAAAVRAAPDDVFHDGSWDYALAGAELAAGQPRAAAGALGRLSMRLDHDQEVRSALAFAVGEASRPVAAPRPPRPPRPRRIVSVFPFNDELTVLKIRLHEMADWVDRFVLVEAAQTFTGNPKPLHYRDHRGEFAAFGSKIVHVALEAFPDHVQAHWARDFHQRDAAAGVLAELCADDDLVLITDVDEIVDRRAVQDFEGDFARLHMPLHRFFLNYRPAPGSRLRNGRTGAVWRADALRRWGLSYARFRLSRLEKDWARIPDAGWHFSALGDAERIARKYANYAHQESGKRQQTLREAGAVADLLDQLKDGRLEEGWERCEVDESFPAWVREHRQELADVIL